MHWLFLLCFMMDLSCCLIITLHVMLHGLVSFQQSVGNKEASGALSPAVPPAEQRPRSSSPVHKPAGSPPHPGPRGPPLPPPSSHTESEAESLLDELQHGREPTGLAGRT